MRRQWLIEARFRLRWQDEDRRSQLSIIERKMTAYIRRVPPRCYPTPRDCLTVMFTHKRAEAWDTLASGAFGIGVLNVEASWPVPTESERRSLHQARKNAAARLRCS